MNLLALSIGLILATYAIVHFRAFRLEKKQWAYPLLLATFPLYYFVFAIYAGDHGALLNEMYVSAIFIAAAYAGYKLQNSIGVIILATGYIGHAVYDVAHNHLFINDGTPFWWPEFCGAVDGLMGLYLVYLAFSFRANRVDTQERNSTG